MEYVDIKHNRFTDPVSGNTCRCRLSRLYAPSRTLYYFVHFIGVNENRAFSLLDLNSQNECRKFCHDCGAKTAVSTIKLNDEMDGVYPPLIAFSDINDLYKAYNALNEKLTEKFESAMKDITDDIKLRFK